MLDISFGFVIGFMVGRLFAYMSKRIVRKPAYDVVKNALR